MSLPIRISKVVFITAIAIFLSLVVFNNITDYWSNFNFVKHVLSMDTTFPGNTGMWRSIDKPWVHHVFYLLVIIAEILAAFFCWKGAVRLYQSRKDASVFKAQKKWAVYGLTLGIIIWFVGFVAVGGEWFLMWQSEDWNGLDVAYKIVIAMSVTLVYLNSADGEDQF